MSRLMITLLLGSVMMLSACGRQLPEGGFQPTSDDADTSEATDRVPETSETTEDTEVAAADVEPSAVTVVVVSPIEGRAAASVAPDTLPDNVMTSLIEAGDPEIGRALYETVAANGFACADCHAVDDADLAALGPGLLGAPQIAAARVPGYSAERYLYTAIVAPDVHLVPGYLVDNKPEDYVQLYSSEEIVHLVAYLMTLDNPDVVAAEVEPAFVALSFETAAAVADAEPAAGFAEVTDNTEAPADDASDDAVAEAEAPADDAVSEAAPADQDEHQLLVSLANPANGEAIFGQTYTTSTGAWACSNCHNAASEQVLVGPGLYNVSQRTTSRVADQSPEAYLFNAIAHPNDYVVEGYSEGLMPVNYEEVFSASEIYDLVAYLMTLSD